MEAYLPDLGIARSAINLVALLTGIRELLASLGIKSIDYVSHDRWRTIWSSMLHGICRPTMLKLTRKTPIACAPAKGGGTQHHKADH